MIRRFAVLGFLGCLGLITLSCSDGPIESPVEPQFARKVKPTRAEPLVEEFWVHRDAESDCAGEIIHIVASGDFLRIATTVAHDHFFNSIRDMGFHFEYGFRGPDAPETEWNAEGTLGHVDVCFQGEQTDHTYPGGEVAYGLFVDYPSTSVGGTGADPFAIFVGVTTSEKNNASDGKGFRPTGVIVGGEMGAPEREVASGTSSWHIEQDFGIVRSYAVWESPPPKGYLFFDGLTLVDASCQVSTEIVGKGKKKTEVTTATVTVQVDFDFGAEDIDGTGLHWDQDFWGEGHVRVTPVEAGYPVLVSDRFRTTKQDGTGTFTLPIDPILSGQDVRVEFLADFLIASPAANPWEGDNVFDYVYDPGRNHPDIITKAGFDGADWDATHNVSKDIHDSLFPVAYSYSAEPFVVTCVGA